jgi:hypothetical protein
VESLGAGNAIFAQDNPFNRWVAGEGAAFFRGSEDLEEIVVSFERSPSGLERMEEASRKRHQEAFTREKVLSAYEDLLLKASRVLDR